MEHWTITGEAVLIGEPPAPVMLAGYYTTCNDFFYASQGKPSCQPARLVSTVARLGLNGGGFELCFDVGSLDPEGGHYIYLILWADSNGNEMYDPGEDWKYVIPLFDDKVFGEATDCVYYYDDRPNEQRGTSLGWNQSAGLERYIPVSRAVNDGARLSNETAWSLERCR
jgi:hypothetical protein